MVIGFDAKRAYFNSTGLGHYSRTLIRSLAEYFPENHYLLCTPKITDRFRAGYHGNINTIVPRAWHLKAFSSAWRTLYLSKELKIKNVALYHGLSNELPLGIGRSGIKSVVTIHDLIFERYPEQFGKINSRIYRAKFKSACQNADKIIAISKQTKEDIMSFYNIPEKKIEICYQSCNPAFGEKVADAELQRIRQKYDLPDKFLLSVGSIIERKNLLNICKAMKHLEKDTDMQLVVIGDGGAYKKIVQDFVWGNNMQNQVIFLSDRKKTCNDEGYKHATDFPAIYKLAQAMIYPSVFEGFGIPVLEALWSRVPVITSNVSCLPETGGDAALYVDPYDPTNIAEGIKKLIHDQAQREEMKNKGWLHAQNFTPFSCANAVMEVYKGVMQTT